MVYKSFLTKNKFLWLSSNDSVSIGCTDFGEEEKSFAVYMRNIHNGLLYNTLVQNPPVTLYISDGFLVKVDNRDITKFHRNKVDLLTDTDANENYIYNLPPPLHGYDACIKGYADAVVKKCHIGLIQSLNRNVDKSGYEASAVSQQGSSYAVDPVSRRGTR